MFQMRYSSTQTTAKIRFHICLNSFQMIKMIDILLLAPGAIRKKCWLVNCKERNENLELCIHEHISRIYYAQTWKFAYMHCTGFQKIIMHKPILKFRQFVNVHLHIKTRFVLLHEMQQNLHLNLSKVSFAQPITSLRLLVSSVGDKKLDLESMLSASRHRLC